jgi:hypothetical protein
MDERQAEVIIRLLGSIRNTLLLGFLATSVLIALLILRHM